MKDRKGVLVWLWVIAVMIFAMVVIGGLTRLTGSGLSMVDWRPLTGWLPPLNEAEWRAAFDAYRQTPEYREFNDGMSLTGFQGIFWLEYAHRLWGRLIAVVFAVPLIVFAVRGAVDRGLGVRFALMFVLGGVQGVLGWWMVKSGLADDPWVSPYRLAAHLGLALALFAFVVWTIADISDRPARPVFGAPAVFVFLAFLTALSGAAVAGIDAGVVYNTFPQMDGALIPDQIWDQKVLAANLFEDHRTVQFNHRVAATLTALCVLGFWLWRQSGGDPVPNSAHASALLMIGQYALGVATLLAGADLPFASAHQAVGTLTLAALVLWAHADGGAPEAGPGEGPGEADKTDKTGGNAVAA